MISYIGDVESLMRFLQNEDADKENGVWKLQGHMVFRGAQVSIDGHASYFKKGKAILLTPALIRRVYGIQHTP